MAGNDTDNTKFWRLIWILRACQAKTNTTKLLCGAALGVPSAHQGTRVRNIFPTGLQQAEEKTSTGSLQQETQNSYPISHLPNPLEAYSQQVPASLLHHVPRGGQRSAATRLIENCALVQMSRWGAGF